MTQETATANRSFPRSTLTTSRLVLRPFERTDAPDVHAVWNDAVYLRFAPAGLPTARADLRAAEEWCAGLDERRRAGGGVVFAAVPHEADRIVGLVSLREPDWTAMITEIHYWTAPWARGHRYAVEAARAVARWAVGDRGFARVTLQVVTDNRASVRVAEDAGFRFEGILRNAAFTTAGRGDMAVYGLTPEDLLP